MARRFRPYGAQRRYGCCGTADHAVDAGDHYILNGNKIFITNAAYAHVYIVMAMTDKSQGTRGISAFIVERDFPGFSIGKKEKKMGIRGSATCELISRTASFPRRICSARSARASASL